MDLDLIKTKERFTLGFVPVLRAALGTDGKKRLSGVASSTIQDRHGDTMTRSALEDMLGQASRLTIFLNHSYEVPEDVAGTVERATLKQATGEIHDLAMDIVINEGNERAVKAWEAIQSGVQLGLSIGAMIPDGGAKVDRKTGAYTIDHVDLVETSIVGVPANPRSWVEYATKALRKSEEQVAAPIKLAPAVEAGEAVFLAIDPDAASPDEPIDATNVDPPIDPIPSEAPEAPLSTEEILDLADAVGQPDIADATIKVETPLGTISVDTGRKGDPASEPSATSQEAPESAPETESAETTAEALPAWMGVPGNPPVQQDLDIASMVRTELTQSATLVATLTRELSEARLALTGEQTARASAERERDEANADLTKVLRETKTLLDKLAATPAGRRATYHEAVGRYEAVRSVYGDEITDHLARSVQT